MANRTLTGHEALLDWNEDYLQRQVLNLAEELGWLTAHFVKALNAKGRWRTPVAGNGKGFPDLVLVHARKQRVLYVELKSSTGALRPEQKVWLAALEDAGEDVRVWRPKDWHDGTIELALR